MPEYIHYRYGAGLGEISKRAVEQEDKIFVPILYRYPAFEAFDDFSDFVESISYETSKSCQVRGSNPCRGANLNLFRL